MADINKQVSVNFKAIDNLSRSVGSMQQSLKNLENETKKLNGETNKASASNKGMETSMFSATVKANLMFGAFNLGIGIVTKLAQSAVQLGKKFVSYLGEASQSAIDFERSLGTLGIIASRTGNNEAEATKQAKLLGKELKIGVGASAEALQNLMASGLNLDQSATLLRRFTNEAITGKSKNLSLAEAVTNLSFAYKTGNSTLGNMSGVSENFNDIVERGAKIMKMKTSDMNEAQLAEAKYRGMIDLTNLTLGSSEKLTTGLVDAQFRARLMADELKISVGQGVNAVLSEMANVIMPKVEQGFSSMMTWIDKAKLAFESWWKSNQDFIKPQLERIDEIIKNVATKLGQLLPPIGENKEAFDNWANGALENAITKFEDLLTGVGHIITYLQSPEAKKAFDDTAYLIGRIADAMFAVVRNVDKAISAFDRFKTILKGMDKVIGGGVIGSTFGLVKAIATAGKSNNAQGTSFFGGGMTTVGENGRENVILPRGSKIIPNRNSGGSQGIVVNVNAPVYGVDNLVATITKAVNEAQGRQNKLGDYNLL
jgi:hypothetical protein